MRLLVIVAALAAAAAVAATAADAGSRAPGELAPSTDAVAKAMAAMDSRVLTGLATAYELYDGEGSAACPDGFARLLTDLNSGLTADKVWLCARREKQEAAGGRAIAAVLTAASANKGWTCPPRWEMVGPLTDLNSGAGGRYVFMCVRRARGGARETPGLVAEVRIARGDDAKCALPWAVPADQEGAVNLNEAAGGDRLVLCSRTVPDERPDAV